MKISVHFFGATADLMGSHNVEIQIDEDSSAADVLQRFSADQPRLLGRKLLFAINERYADELTRLKDGDELAIFTPVSGG